MTEPEWRARILELEPAAETIWCGGVEVLAIPDERCGSHLCLGCGRRVRLVVSGG